MVSHEYITRIIAYFEAKDNRTDEEQEFLDQLKLYSDAFPIAAVTRADLESKGFDVEKISDEQMVRLAGKLGDDYCENMFWDSLDILADLEGFQKVGDKDGKLYGCTVTVEWETDGDDAPPSEIALPDGIDEDEVSEWLSDEYEYLVKGYTINYPE